MTPLVALVYNCKVHRLGLRVLLAIRAYIRLWDPDVIGLQEAHQYGRWLRLIRTHTRHQLPRRRWRDAAGVALLVRRSWALVGDLEARRVGDGWPRPRMPGWHPPRTLVGGTFRRPDNSLIDVWVLHMPVDGGRGKGKPQRHADYVAIAQAIRGIASATSPGRPLLFLGDWNKRLGPGGRPDPSPWDIARASGMETYDAGTIDGGMGRHLDGDAALHNDRRGSDHRPVTIALTPTSTEEPIVPWRVADSLQTLHAEINEAAPNRDRASDGSIGDPAHASRASDHNPWIVKDGVGIVRARDWDHDPAGGLDCAVLAQRLAALMRADAHPALRSGAYIIFRRRILARDRLSEGWRVYSGPNAHLTHLHLSVTTDPSAFDDTRPWGVMEEEVTEQDKLDIAALVVQQLLAAEVDVLGDKDAAPIPLLQVLRQTHNRAGKTLAAMKERPS